MIDILRLLIVVAIHVSIGRSLSYFLRDKYVSRVRRANDAYRSSSSLYEAHVNYESRIWHFFIANAWFLAVPMLFLLDWIDRADKAWPDKVKTKGLTKDERIAQLERELEENR